MVTQCTNTTDTVRGKTHYTSMKKLHELKNGAKIFCETSDGSEYIIFDHVDGLYSYCTTEQGGVALLSAVACLQAVEGGYKLVG